MDLKTEKYFGLSMREAIALNGCVLGWSMSSANLDADNTINVDEIVHALVQLGLLTRVESQGKPAQFCSVQIEDAVHFRGTVAPAPKIKVRDVYNFVYACTCAFIDLKMRPLDRIVDRVRKRKLRRAASSAAREKAELYHLVRVFRLLTPFFYTAKGVCLFDSLALTEFLARYRIFPSWVIGVRTRPFGAHSWVQQGELVLNEKLEAVEEFSPIFVV